MYILLCIIILLHIKLENHWYTWKNQPRESLYAQVWDSNHSALRQWLISKGKKTNHSALRQSLISKGKNSNVFLLVHTVYSLKKNKLNNNNFGL